MRKTSGGFERASENSPGDCFQPVGLRHRKFNKQAVPSEHRRNYTRNHHPLPPKRKAATRVAAFSLFVQRSMLSRKTFSYSVAVLFGLSLFVVLKSPPTLGGHSKHKVLHGFKTLLYLKAKRLPFFYSYYIDNNENAWYNLLIKREVISHERFRFRK